MNLEQIVKETVAKFVAEKKGKDLTGDGKIDSADYLKARSNAIDKAKNLDEDHEDHEVSMAQRSLDSILRSAMELKAKIGNQEINIPAWIQDHITNSETYIDQASQGYHEYENGGEHGEMDESQEISSDELFQLQATADDTSKMPAERDAARNKIYASRAKKESQQELNEDKMDKEELKQSQIDKAYDHLEKMKENTKLFSKDDIKKAEARIEKLEAELDALADKATNESLDEATVRRWQHYAGIK
jgi:hypothetical protein